MIFSLALALAAAELPLLSPVFGDHMVLQRDRLNSFWGWAPPGTRVRVQIQDHAASGVAGPDGRWLAKVKPPKAGGPYRVVIDGPSRLELQDVLVGDVWICSGQSNMEFGIKMSKGGETAVANANDPNLRLFMVGRQVAYAPSSTLVGTWKPCTPKTVAEGGWEGFSAVGYYFGQRLRQEIGVPIGLIESSWGGTSAEAWTSESALRPLHDFDTTLNHLDELRAKSAPPYGTYVSLWLAENDAGTRSSVPWQSDGLDTSGWENVTLPGEPPSAQGKHGAFWFRKDFTLPESETPADVTLNLGQVNQVDATYVNGHLLGTMDQGWMYRRYTVPAEYLHAGRNSIAVDVFDTDGKAGFNSRPEEMYVQLANGQRIPLQGDWNMKVGVDASTLATQPHDYEPNPGIPFVLNYGMIQPLTPLAIKGAIWYQGETNGGRGYQYRRLLPALIEDWRKSFGQGDFPFYIVSLANWQPRRDKPGDDNWSELREAQAMTAATVPNSGLAVTIDVGDAADIHPKDKKTVGDRLAAIALAKAYGKSVPYSGPIYKRVQVQDNRLVLSFEHIDGGLEVHGPKLGEFQIAGIDRKWAWAEAKIVGDTVELSSADVTHPVAARYAWQTNPEATLYNKAGFPAVPFRTDDWPELSLNNK
jgi:sialate O-acetylesterase